MWLLDENRRAEKKTEETFQKPVSSTRRPHIDLYVYLSSSPPPPTPHRFLPSIPPTNRSSKNTTPASNKTENQARALKPVESRSDSFFSGGEADRKKKMLTLARFGPKVGRSSLCFAGFEIRYVFGLRWSGEMGGKRERACVCVCVCGFSSSAVQDGLMELSRLGSDKLMPQPGLDYVSRQVCQRGCGSEKLSGEQQNRLKSAHVVQRWRAPFFG